MDPMGRRVRLSTHAYFPFNDNGVWPWSNKNQGAWCLSERRRGVKPEKKRTIYLGLQRGANQTLRDGELKPFRNHFGTPLKVLVVGSLYTLFRFLVGVMLPVFSGGVCISTCDFGPNIAPLSNGIDVWLQIVYHPAQWEDNESHKHLRQSVGILAHRNWDYGFIIKCRPDFWTEIWGYQKLSPFPTATNWTFGQFMNESHSCLKLIKSGSIRLWCIQEPDTVESGRS